MSDPSVFRAWLKRRRLERGLTQEALGELAGYSSQMIRKVEVGQRRPSPQLALRLAEVLQIPPDEHAAWMASAFAEEPPDAAQLPASPAPRPEQAEDAFAGWFARTKLHPPRQRRDTLSRPRLLAPTLRALDDARLLLLSAPAGAGKTTLLSTLIAQLQAAEGPPLRLAWVSLDRDDNDLARLLLVLAEAWDAFAPGSAQQARAMLGGATAERTQLGRQVLTALVNALLAAPPARNLLVLDDLHLLDDPTVLATLAYLIDQIPPTLTVAVATRQDPALPLARLRARRELLELRFADLRFTAEEMAALLNANLGLRLSADELAALYSRTEGWAAGLAMLAASLLPLDEAASRDRLLDHLARSDRHLFDYLADEVIAGQDPFVRAFLLETSILAELTPESCSAVTGRADAGAILDNLYRRNLFLVEVAERPGQPERARPAARPAYRYHDLFREVLLHRLQSEAPAWFQMLHRRAAGAEPVPARRIAHYLQAEAWDAAAQEMVQIGGEAIERGAFDLVWGWIDQLPPAARAAHPRLSLWRGVVLWHRLAVEDAGGELLAALRGFEAAGDGAGQEEALAWLALVQSERADLPLDAHFALRLRLASALGLLLTDRWATANELLDGLLAEAEERGEPWWVATIADELQLLFAILPGGVRRFERLLACLERLPEHERPPGALLRLKATIAVWRGRQAEAREHCAGLAALLQQEPMVAWASLNLRGILAVVFGMDGSHAADPFLDSVLSYLERQRGSFTRGVLVSFQFLAGRAALLRGELDAARQVAERIATLSRGSGFTYVRALYLVLIGRIALAEGRLPDAAEALTEAAAMQERARFTVLYGDAPLLLATIAVLQGRQADALELLAPRLQFYAAEDLPGLLAWQGPAVAPALRLAAERGLVAPFVRRVLASFGEAVAEQPAEAGRYVPATGELLSAREVEVLRLLAAGASNPAIAARLMISPHTAKHHVSSVLAKLGVHSRAAAAAAAHDLGLA